MRIKSVLVLLLVSLFSANVLRAQIVLGEENFDYANPKEYTLAGVEFNGLKTLDKSVIKLMSGLIPGEKIKIPGDDISEAIKSLWKQGFFDEIKITATKVIGNDIFLQVDLKEKPRLSKFSFKGRKIRKGDADDLREKIRLIRGKIVTDYLIGSTETQVKDYYIDKGFYNAKVNITVEEDKNTKDHVVVFINIDKGKKVRIKDVDIVGNTVLPQWRLKFKMKETKAFKWYNPFNSGKFLEENLEKDKPAILGMYYSRGYRDAKIKKDSIYFVKKNRLKIDLHLEEGSKYYFRNITWAGNSKFRSGYLDTVLNIKKGDVYDQAHLEQKLYSNPNGVDISAMYMDDGYLFFQINPTEVNVENDSIDLNIQIYEGKQARINRVTVVGNTKTNDHVIYREIRTRPGQLFRRSEIMRTQRELSQLGFFDPEKMGVNPVPNQADGTVDIEYTVEEKPSDQLQLSGGWGGGRVVGTLGVTFNNFSTRNIFKPKTWTPLPTGDGQKLNIQAQSTGQWYQGYNISFTEPWLGGKKPNSLTLAAYYNVQNFTGAKRFNTEPGTGTKIFNREFFGKKTLNPNASFMTTAGGTVGFGKRMKWPDDYFYLYIEESYAQYNVRNAGAFFIFPTGISDQLKTTISVNRNSTTGNPIFPTGGSVFSVSAMLTPPFSLFNNKDYTKMSLQERYKYVEFQKYKFTATWYMQLTNQKAKEGKEAHNLVLRTSVGFGFLGFYNRQIGAPPFERFYLGGSGLTGFSLYGREIIALRGYDDNSIAGADGKGASYISKYTLELRFPVSLNQQATIWAHGFAEAGNAVQKFSEFNPFNVKRSAGVGLRVFLPMFGLLGIDYAWGFDRVPYYPGTGNGKGQFHFTIGANLGEL